jgi:hypothetical protein
MKFTQFVKMALNMTSKYYNKYVNECKKEITKTDICIDHTINNKDVYVCVLCVQKCPDQKYVVCYYKQTQCIKSYITNEIPMEETYNDSK